MTKRTVDNYSLTQIVLHWLIVVLIIAAFLLGDQMEGWEKLPENAALPLHGKIGLTVFFLMILRLFLRLFRGAPPPPEADPAWQRKVAGWTHWTLYALAILVPWSGGFAFYLRIEAAAAAHEVFKALLLILALAHTAAAIYHQFVMKDGLMDRMRMKRS